MDINDISEFKSQLATLVAFKSISTDPEYKQECENCAQFISNLLSQNGFQTKLIQSTKTNPVVFAKYEVSSESKTILIYGHYDVQPANKSDGWSTSDPFVIEEKDNKLIARGSIDNKGQLLVHIYTIINLIKTNNLKYNIKFLIEGNEETGNTEIFSQVKTNANDLSCDLILISDGERPAIDDNLPVLETSLRGGANATLTFKTSHTNLHSGIYGRAVPTAIEEMYLYLSKIYTADNVINIQGYYDELPLPTDDQLQNNKILIHEKEDEVLKSAGTKAFKTESNYDFYTQTGLRPSIIVTGIIGGYTGSGYANIVPNECSARINFRFVEPQNPNKCLELFKTFIEKNVPSYVDWKFLPNDPYRGYFADTSSSDFQETEKILMESYKADKVVHKNVGGGIPIVTCFKDVLGRDTILLPLASHDCNMHGADENFSLPLLIQGLEFSKMFFGK